jgi:hypothetical protein
MLSKKRSDKELFSEISQMITKKKTVKGGKKARDDVAAQEHVPYKVEEPGKIQYSEREEIFINKH